MPPDSIEVMVSTPGLHEDYKSVSCTPHTPRARKMVVYRNTAADRLRIVVRNGEWAQVAQES